MASDGRRPMNLLKTLLQLRGGASVNVEWFSGEMSLQERESVTDILVELSYAQRQGDQLVALPAVYLRASEHAISRICEWVVEEEPEGGFRRLMDYLTSQDTTPEMVDIQESSSEEVDPEVLNRYVREYIEVESDLEGAGEKP